MVSMEVSYPWPSTAASLIASVALGLWMPENQKPSIHGSVGKTVGYSLSLHELVRIGRWRSGRQRRKGSAQESTVAAVGTPQECFATAAMLRKYFYCVSKSTLHPAPPCRSLCPPETHAAVEGKNCGEIKLKMYNQCCRRRFVTSHDIIACAFFPLCEWAFDALIFSLAWRLRREFFEHSIKSPLSGIRNCFSKHWVKLS